MYCLHASQLTVVRVDGHVCIGVRACVRVCVRACVRRYMHACVRVCIHCSKACIDCGLRTQWVIGRPICDNRLNDCYCCNLTQIITVRDEDVSGDDCSDTRILRQPPRGFSLSRAAC